MFTDGFKKSDTHMHPNLLRHPEQAGDFILRAIDEGFDMICFTDHMYHPRSDAPDRMLPGRLGEYCDTVHALAEKWASQITLKCGIEVDYWPPDEPMIRELLAQGTFDHVIGSSHLAVEMYPYPLARMTRDELADVCLRNTLQAAKTGLFDTVSHLDQYRWAYFHPERFPLMESEYHLEKHIPLMRQLFEYLQDTGIALEVNSYAIRKGLDPLGQPHPEDAVLRLSREYCLNYVFASDAHVARDVGAGYARSLEPLGL